MANPRTIPSLILATQRVTDSFIAEDLKLLNEIGNVRLFELGAWHANRRTRFWRRLRQIRHAVKLAVDLLRSDTQAVIFWFAPMYETLLLSLVTKLLQRKVVIITGGGDAVHVPEIDWGALKYPPHYVTFGWTMRLVDSVLPFSDSARRWIAKRFQPRQMRTIYPSIDTTFFQPAPTQRRQRVVTCCYEVAADNIVQKGLDIFVEAAKRLSDVEFVVVGNAIDDVARDFQRSAPANITFVPRIPTRSGYRDFLQTCSVYAQLSAHEGFGVSLAEAMACGCAPVATDRYSLPEVVGPDGWLVPYGLQSVEQAAQAIREALAATEVLRARFRQHVVTNFPRKLRQQQLRHELARLLPQANVNPVRIDLGSGSSGVLGTIGVDLRMTSHTQALCDIRYCCFAGESADEVYAYCVLEHLDNPYELLDEVVRVLKPDGCAYLRVPNLGTFSAHLDTTHRFLADLSLWRAIMHGYFEEVEVLPVGTKYRDNRLLKWINQLLIDFFKFYELTQGWTFVCRRKRAQPFRAYTGWWQEGS
jgi:glycosyltransferase involved in cell wall biosynthesis